MFNQDEREDLRGSDHWIVIPYIHGRESCIVVCVAVKAELNLSAPVVRPTFYSLRPSSYTMTQGPTRSPMVVESLYGRTLLARSSK
jgi:hypothetical protein